MKIKFTIYGDPKAKRRHRSRIAGRPGKQFVATYADPKGVDEEDDIRVIAAQHRPPKLMMGAIYLGLNFYLPIPKSMTKARRRCALTVYLVSKMPWLRCVQFWPTKKPDLDNLEKLVKDACNKVIWYDDAQVCAVQKFKYYGEEPRTEVYIEDLPSEY